MAHAAPVQDPAFAAAAAARFTVSERDKLARILRSERRLQFIFSHWLARGLLAHGCGRPVEWVAIEVTPEGRPQPTGCGDLGLSLAHSGPWVVALVAPAVTGECIGVDVEADARALGTGWGTGWPARRRRTEPRDDAVTAAWVLGEAQAKAGAYRQAPSWQARCDLDTPDEGQAMLHLAAANVEISPRVCLVKVEGGSYNPRPIDLEWIRAHT